MGIGLGLGIQFYKKAGARLSAFLTWGQSVPARFWGTETPEYWGGIDPQAQIAYDSLIAAGFTTPQGLGGINAAFSVVKEIYGTSDITTVISFFGDPSLAYEAGAGSGTTLGQAIRTLPNIIDPTRATDAVQTTAASQPLLLTHTSGENYWFGSGVANNFVSTPNAAANQITGDFEAIIKVNFYSTSVNQMLLCKFNIANNFAYLIRLDGATKNLTLIYSTNGSNAFFDSSTASGIVINTDYWIKVNRVRSTGITSFFISTDGTNYSLISSAPAQNANVGFFAGTNILTIGERVGGVDLSNAKIYRATISNSIGGAPVVDFNPNQYNPSTSQTQWTSSTGEVWSISTGTATTGYKGQLVDRTIIQSDGIDDVLNSTISNSGRFTQYLSVSPFGSIVGNEAIAGPWNGSLWRGAIYTSSSRFATYQGTGVDGVFGSTITKARLILVGVVNSSTGTDWQPFINGVDVSNGGLNIGSQNNYTSVNIFARSGGSTFTNSQVNTYILTKQADNSTQRTSIYNYIRSINNAAF